MNQKLKPVDDQEQPPPLVVDPADILYSIDLNGAPGDSMLHRNHQHQHPSNINNRGSFTLSDNSFKPTDDLSIDVRGVPEYYRTDDDSYRPFTIYGNHGESRWDRLSWEEILP